MIVRYLIACISVCFFIQCKEKVEKKQNAKTYTETFEIFDTKGDERNAEPAALRFFESREYRKGVPLNTTYYEADGTIKGKDVFSFLANDTIADGSTYFDKDGKILSTYKYIINPEGKKIASYGFDDKGILIRIESYEYEGKNIKRKIIRESDFTVYRDYKFTFDQYDNETALKVYDGLGKLLVDEEFRIIKKGVDNRWIEKWGFVNGKPITFHKRK